MRGSSLIFGVLVCLPSWAADGPASVVVLADDADYKTAKATEMIFEGVLERTPSKGTLGGPVRFNPYRLLARAGAGKPVAHELFVANKAPLLAVHVGRRVRIVGKLVEVATDGGRQLELWPARVEAITETLAEVPADDAVYARSNWQPETARKVGFRWFVFRDGTQLAREMKLTGTTAGDTATSLLGRELRVPALDWGKHMIVTVSAGLRGRDAEKLTVTRVAVEDDKMTVYYRLEAGGPGFGYPAETVLVDRFAGTIRVEEEKAPPAPKK